MSNNIAGKIVVITDASSGLGQATARLLSVQGANVVPGARRIDRCESAAHGTASIRNCFVSFA
jgi:NADP-dependent 3-hydroxy acid dehydrogenase YdfG